MLVISIARGSSIRSRLGVLLERARDWLSRHDVKVASRQVLNFPAEDLLHACFDSPSVLALAEQVGRADSLLIAIPVYKASFSDMLKVLSDLLPERTLEHKVVLSFATGGSSAHTLAVDYALRPVPAALKAQGMLHDVFAADKQIAYAAESDPACLEPVLEQHLESTLETFHLTPSR